MQAKDEEMIKFLDQDNEKQAKRKRSIATRTYHSELHKTSVNGMSYIIKLSSLILSDQIGLGRFLSWKDENSEEGLRCIQCL